jgi:DNA primase
MEKNLQDTIREDTELVVLGKNFVAICPFHEEITPSFAVNPQRQRFQCFGCGKSGGLKEYLEFRAAKPLPTTIMEVGGDPSSEELITVYRRNRKPLERNRRF